jgi:hypothetical protein
MPPNTYTYTPVHRMGFTPTSIDKPCSCHVVSQLVVSCLYLYNKLRTVTTHDTSMHDTM